MNTTTHDKHCIEVCNSLLRGELSAVETYHQAIEKFDGNTDLTELIRIKDEHQTSVNRLRANVVEMGGSPDADSGAWGTFAQSVQAAANLFGENSAITALQKGEEHGKKDYEKALEDQDVMPECKQMISLELLPRINQHLAALERIGNR